MVFGASRKLALKTAPWVVALDDVYQREVAFLYPNYEFEGIDIDHPVAFCYLSSVSQPVKLSDALVLDARLTAEIAERSIAGQIEFWARLGRAIEPLLRGDQALAVRRAGDSKSLSQAIQTANSAEGRQHVNEYLKSLPYPHYEQADSPGLLVRIDSNGKRTIGRFVNRQFRPIKKARR